MIRKNNLIIGTANFFTPYGVNSTWVSVIKKKKIFLYLQKNKINFFDISDSYGNIAKNDFFLKKKFKKIIFKFRLKNINNFTNDINKTIKNLNINKIYCFMFHNEKELFSKKGKIILQKANEYKIKKKFFQNIGVSIYSVNTLKKIIKNKIQIDIVQLPLNILNQSFSKEILHKANLRGIKIHARSIFLQGLLLNKTSKIDNKVFKRKLSDLDFLTKKNKTSRLYECLNFISSFKYIDKIVIGVDNMFQLKDILNALKIKRRKYDYSKFAIKNENLIDPRKWKKKH